MSRRLGDACSWRMAGMLSGITQRNKKFMALAIMLLSQQAASAVAVTIASHAAWRSTNDLMHGSAIQANKREATTGAMDTPLFQDDRIAIAIYAPSIYARQLKCEAAIESIRSQGRWGGKIYLLTEQVKCYQHERWTQCGLDADIIVLDDPIKHAHTASRRWGSLGPFWELTKSRALRSQVWDLTKPPEAVQALVYMQGCDFLVGAPLQPFLQHALAQFDQPAVGSTNARPVSVVVAPPPVPPHKHKTITLLDKVKRLELGKGAWVLHRTHSAKLLQAWRDEVKSYPDASEGHILLDALHRMDSECTSAMDCAQRSVAIADAWSMELECDSDNGCDKAVPTTFNYLPPSVCVSFDHEMVSDWVTSLDLCVYQELGYCPPLLMTPFALAWLPYPQCAKLELGLSRLSCQWTCTDTSFMRSAMFRTSVTTRTMAMPLP